MGDTSRRVLLGFCASRPPGVERRILTFVFFRKRPANLWDNSEPIREELFSTDRLEAHGCSLAAAQPVSAQRIRVRKLSRRLADNGASLLLVYRAVAKAIGEGRAITPAAEWLVDNYHLIEKQIREIRADLPAGYYRQLPKLAAGPFEGYPRVFGIAWAFVAHTDSHFDAVMLLRYVKAYQSVQPLTIGELWAIPVTLRIVLIENLRRVAQQIAHNRAMRQQADELADRLLGAGGREPESAPLVFARHEHIELDDAFAVQLVHRLRDQDPRITPALTWLDRRLAAQDMSADAVVREVHRRQGASNVTVRNIITSLRLIGDVDWQELIEQLCLVDEVLAADSDFRDMDFPTRNLYRTAVERLARGSGREEIEIAHAAMQEAAAAGTGRAHDPGYYLLGGGRRGFAQRIGQHVPFWRRLGWVRQNRGLRAYGGAILGVAALLLAFPLLALGHMGLGLWYLTLLGLLGAIPALDVAVALVNRAVTFGFGAALLPAMELRDGIPSHLRTLVVVPVLLTTPAAIEEQIERLEIHHLACGQGDLHFALLSDWADSATEHDAGDEVLLAVASAGITRLNASHAPAPGGPRFLLLHRRRMWAPSETLWMGWERKRGKLHELNRLLRHAADTSFITSAAVPADVRYVVTLDADTRLPREAIRRLIGKMAHPLNQPRLDAATGRIVEGYAVLQPRVTPSLPIGQEGSLFQRIFSSLSGIDPYAAAVSDVYQDLFGEGSYAGKGIYDVDAFEAALAGRVPEASLLSHDLFEGIFARAGLASDIEVVEEFPARYDVGALRHHRWARGDWQLLPWILGRGMPAVGRWKMIDNLRRTLVAPAAVLALLAGWTLPLTGSLIWTGFVLATILVPPMIPVVMAIPPRRPGVTLASHIRALGGDLRLALWLASLVLTFLAHQAWLMGDAITRTLYRLCLSRRHLLEWITAAQAATGPRLGRMELYRHMAGALVFAVAGVVITMLVPQGSWQLALPFAVLWCASPLVARWVSAQPLAASQVSVSAQDALALRLIARRTWRFFESTVSPADNALPPDNFQEEPRPVLARRTSPTNIGLYLLSVASAHDFGWIGRAETAERLEACFATLDRLERFRGHFYNWYDTQDLRPLDPKYVSTVDSGNLAGHLIALANACRAWQCASGTAPPLAGLADAAAIACEEAAHLRAGPRTQTVTWDQLDTALGGLAAATRVARDGVVLATLAAQAAVTEDIASAFASERGGEAGADMLFWAQASLRAIQSHERDLAQADVQMRLAALEARARNMALEMEFGFLLNRERMLLSIGYLVPERIQDSNCYDLLASEARLASFFAIAKGDIPARHWFRLGRAATPVGPGAALISWSGSMFEYLMPSLVMRAPLGSLLEQTNRLIVRRQIEYGQRQRRPWGISESAYNARDLELTYQYSNFGVPGLGLKRGLGENVVMAPYATALAAMVAPGAARANFARLAQLGALGRYGFYEALDYTPSRVPEGDDVAIIRSFMAHHQGMSIVAISDTLLDGVMRGHFHAEPMIQATELLLQERMPRDVAIVHPWEVQVHSPAQARFTEPAGGRHFTSAFQPAPVSHLLSNGRFTTMLTTSGSGYTSWDNLAVTRWREDATRDDHGSYIFIRNTRSNEVWSAGYQPSGMVPKDYTVAFTEDRALFTRRDGPLITAMEVLVSSEDHAEIRRIALTNDGKQACELEITSYAELVLAPLAADIAHPAFSKLFVETEYLAGAEALIATRRRRAPGEAEIWAAHLAIVEEGAAIGGPTYETDRARFLGRGHDIRSPLAMSDGQALSNTSGTVLDAVFALRRRVRIAPGATVHIAFWTLVAPTRAALLDDIDRHRDSTAFDRVTTLAWTQAQVQLHHLGIDAGEAARFQQLAGHIIHASQLLRPALETIKSGAGAQAILWPQGISGDLPILLLRIADIEHLEIVRQLLQAQEYWRLKGLAVDLVILNERQSSYVQDLQIALETLVRTSEARRRGDAVGGRVFVRRADLLTPGCWALFSAMARAVLLAQRGSLGDQLDRIVAAPQAVRPARVTMAPPAERAALPARPKLEFPNGLGGFAEAGREYVTILEPGQSTPAPWINVIANPSFGFHVSTEGSGYTWAVNSRENQLTPWSNDPVSDRAGEAFYLRDEESDALWSPVAYPIRDPAGVYVARHGHGYSGFTHTAHGIAAELLQFVPLDAPVKLSRLTLHNQSGRARSLSLTAYVEWVLGASRGAAQAFVITELDQATGALFAVNPWSNAFGARVAFLDIGGRQVEATGDRTGFIGRNGTLASPLALAGDEKLSGRLGAGLDPCGALRAFVVLPPDGRTELTIRLGQAENAEVARRLVTQYRAADLDKVLADVNRHWNDVLGAVQVKTPDRAMDIMLNGWLLYQTLSSRVWARAGFYQASGAYGFRDQLQDGMALTASYPAETRAHLLRAAGRQFLEGDVQHWWLPHSGQGVRTRISDDRAWLAYAVSHYVTASGDAAVLDESIAFLEGPVLDEGVHDSFFQPVTSEQSASLFEHCALALDASLALGGHGLPLIGTGDWNDGMNRVGERGAGESVWLGWFLHSALQNFIPLASARGDAMRANAWQAHATSLRAALEHNAWDGNWYCRGFYDDGSKLGAAENEECRIDSIAQSWAVLSGAAAPERAARAMAAVEQELLRPADGVALLFTPPFNKTLADPGYIKSYPPGIRENGGQYTHAALWSVMAFAALGQGDKAAGLFALLNPINHAGTRADVHRYKTEPYAVTADIYAQYPHMGRGGWSWYTGSAGWMQRAGIESILGMRIEGAQLYIDPCIPRSWPGFEVMLRYRSARYEISVENPGKVSRGIACLLLDGIACPQRPARLLLQDDGLTHWIKVRLLPD
jgi:cyclic beta-1,2-glucan synthetase